MLTASLNQRVLRETDTNRSAQKAMELILTAIGARRADGSTHCADPDRARTRERVDEKHDRDLRPVRNTVLVFSR